MPLIDYRGALSYNRIPTIGPTGSGGSSGGVFRSSISPAVQSPSVTPASVTPGPGGVYRDWTSFSQLASIGAIANPGDVLRQTASISGFGELRGNRFGLGGTARDGAAGNHITVTAADSNIVIDAGDNQNFKSTFDLIGLEHVDAIGLNVRNSTFGLRVMCCGGSASSPIRIARNTAINMGHSAFPIFGWWTNINDYGGTAPSGAGNEYGYTNDFIFELNQAENTGLWEPRYGEAFYLGRGTDPGWFGRAMDGVVRYNIAKNTSELIDVKLGCMRLHIHSNLGYELSPNFGATCVLFYMTTESSARPSWATDPEVYFEQNRVYDVNLTNTRGGGTYKDLVWVGLSGVRFAQNAFWSGIDGSRGLVLVSEQSTETDFGTDPTWVLNNLFWVDEGVFNRGYGVSPTITPFTLGAWYDQLNNIGPTGISGVEFTTGSSNFVGPVPAVDAFGTADAGPGPGSAFELISAHTLGSGTTITPEDLYLEHDLLQRTIPATNPDPGPFQAV